MPENSNELVISDSIYTNAKVKYNIGDKVTFDIGDRVSNNNETFVFTDGTVIFCK